MKNLSYLPYPVEGSSQAHRKNRNRPPTTTTCCTQKSQLQRTSPLRRAHTYQGIWGGGEGERATTLSSQTRLPFSGQVQCTSWRNFAPFSPSTFKNIHGEQASKKDRGASAVGARHIVREHATTQTVLNKDIKRAQGISAAD